jgi:phosphoribosylaminoimidazole-succinocarboxamide synthase
MAQTHSSPVFQTQLPDIPLRSRGKVRDVYDLGDRLLIVVTDRLSAFDYVLPNPIPDKGRVLNQISDFWFRRTAVRVPNHVIATDVAEFPGFLREHADVLAGRSTLVHKLEMVPVECVARGYLAGSGWKEYQRSGTVCGIRLPAGLRESDRLAEPIFTPATKAVTGHDENIPFARVEAMVGKDLAAKLRDTTLALYHDAVEAAAERGILIADTKLEFGLDRGTLVVGDEMFTPDSSRFWPAAGYAAGTAQPSFDKQFVRDYLDSIGWNRQPPVPSLPAAIIEGTRQRYLEIFRILTGGAPD